VGKSNKAVTNAVACFTKDLAAEFSGLGFEPVLDPEDGYDAWVYVYVPANADATEDAVRAAARDIEDRYWCENGIGLIAMIRTKKEPVHG
jgi:hypothetical protein